jgi:hypothetical protein
MSCSANTRIAAAIFSIAAGGHLRPTGAPLRAGTVGRWACVQLIMKNQHLSVKFAVEQGGWRVGGGR